MLGVNVTCRNDFWEDLYIYPLPISHHTLFQRYLCESAAGNNILYLSAFYVCETTGFVHFAGIGIKRLSVTIIGRIHKS